MINSTKRQRIITNLELLCHYQCGTTLQKPQFFRPKHQQTKEDAKLLGNAYHQSKRRLESLIFRLKEHSNIQQ